jgi:[lysine-biosynthesis-protein LysW]--L-2-aminoadipate ligase
MRVATAVDVLCARVRVEEKWLIEALAEAGVPARPLPPTNTPLPIGPVPFGPLVTTVAGGGAAELSGVIVDRCIDRIVAGAVIPSLRAMGAIVIDGGRAATGNRLAIATALAVAGIPRPATLLATSEEAGIAALQELGYPATLLPLDGGALEIPLIDRDIAEAVLEHREVLGSSMSAVSLIQAGARFASNQFEVLVLGGRAVAQSERHPDGVPSGIAAALAEATSRVLGAAILGVTVAMTADGPVVWDVRAVPEFRAMLATDGDAIATAFRNLIHACRGRVESRDNGIIQMPLESDFSRDVSLGREVADGVVLSA